MFVKIARLMVRGSRSRYLRNSAALCLGNCLGLLGLHREGLSRLALVSSMILGKETLWVPSVACQVGVE